jgi:DNA/RNA-binding domain of Phe-tRNA-synthetase-like protein
MFDVSISSQLRDAVPGFKIGVIYYPSIVIGDLPPLIGDRLPLYYENIQLSLDEHPVSEIAGVKEWRSLFKKVGTDPSRYRPSQEALLRKIKKDGRPHFIHSAVDLLNFFSVQHSIPMGLYDVKQLREPVQIKIGTEADQYEGLNGRTMHMNDKIVSADTISAFGSPIVDSKRTCVTEQTSCALQIVYLRPSMDREEALQLIAKMAEMFTQVHGGNHEFTLIQ